jgi:hypothetical protein
MPKLPFTVSARTAKLIGQENFSNAEGAIVELVKNAYDADATNCIIIFDNSVQNKEAIYIIDNGIGMTEKVIYKSWMTIGTNNKQKNHTSSKTGRVQTGAKGIGRFALDRLGMRTTIYTCSKKEENNIIWKVRWNRFNEEDVNIHEVKANLRKVFNIQPINILSKKFHDFSILNDYIATLDKSEWQYGTILKIEKVKDDWTNEELNSLYKNLEVLTPPVEQESDFKIHLFSTKQENKDKYGEINSISHDEYDYKLSFKYLANKNKEIEVQIIRNELDLKRIKNEYLKVFNFIDMQSDRYNLKSFEQTNIKFTTSINNFKGFKKVDPLLLKNIGEFDFTFYYIKNIEPNKEDREIYPYKSFSTSIRKNWLSKYSGVKIFRDGFRVRPYGEKGNDWLNLGQRQAKSPAGAGDRKGGFRIRPNQISGTINISRLENKNFEDKSGREGIQENNSFETFTNILLECIKIFETDRNIVM